jgi:hypothetical protein
VIVDLNDTYNCGIGECRIQKLLAMPEKLPAIIWPQIDWPGNVMAVYVKTPYGGSHVRSFRVCPIHHAELLTSWEQTTTDEIAEQEADIAYHLREEGSYDQGEAEGDLLHGGRSSGDLQGDRVDSSGVVQAGPTESSQAGPQGVAG